MKRESIAETTLRKQVSLIDVQLQDLYIKKQGIDQQMVALRDVRGTMFDEINRLKSQRELRRTK